MKKRAVALLAVAVLVLACFAAGCGGGSKGIVGSWAGDGSYSSFVYTFKEDGTGSYSVAGAEMKFKYEDNQGKSVKITYDGNTTGSTYEYRIDGNKLIIKDSFGSEVTYVRK